MDESWRIPIGSMVPRRRSTEQTRSSRQGLLDPEDFRDVFGGPPRTVLLRRFSGEFRSGATFYDEVFRPTERERSEQPLGGEGRKLPGLRIPGGGKSLRADDGFYDDIFGSGRDGRRLRSRSKSKSRSLSPDRSTPHRPSADDVVLSSFTSKLRPITIPSRRADSSPPSTISGDEQSSHMALDDPFHPQSSFMDTSYNNSDDRSVFLFQQQPQTGFNCCFSPPEGETMEHKFCRGNVGTANLYADSPSSAASSSVYMEQLRSKIRPYKKWKQVEREQEKVVIEVEEGTAANRCFVIEMDSYGARENTGSASVDEAIAWAKERFWNRTSDQARDSEGTKGDTELGQLNSSSE